MSSLVTLVDDLIQAWHSLRNNHLYTLELSYESGEGEWVWSWDIGPVMELQAALNCSPHIAKLTSRLDVIQSALDMLVKQAPVQWCVRQSTQAYSGKLPGRRELGLDYSPTMNHTPDEMETYSILLEKASIVGGETLQRWQPQVGVRTNEEWIKQATGVMNEIKKQRWFDGEVTNLTVTVSDACEIIQAGWGFNVSVDGGPWIGETEEYTWVELPAAGTYTLRMSSISHDEIIKFQNVEELTSIDDCNGLGFGIFGEAILDDCLEGCSNLSGVPFNIFDYCTETTKIRAAFAGVELPTLPDISKLKKVQHVSGLFHSTKNMGEIPIGYFDNCTEAISMGYMFAYSSVTSIPAGLFDNCPLVENFEYCFQSTSISSVPSGIFDNNPKVTTFLYCFKNSNVGGYPSFANCPDVTSFYGCFSGCENLPSPPADLFAYNLKVNTFVRCFHSTLITSIPADLFAYNPEVKYFTGCFYSCGLLTAIPIGLFDNCQKVVRFGYPSTYRYGCFEDCINLTGDAPDLWNRDPEPEGDKCFRNCEGLSNYDSIPGDWK